MSSDDDNDEYIVHGKLLDPIQEDEIVKKKYPDNQFVKDENGLRRFHGAFTGGFSAGYYNTVGSLEGWTPRTFKSSRNSKCVTTSQNAYDFMDEEDKKSLGVDSSSLKIKSEYNNHPLRKRKYPEIDNGPIPGKPILGEILKPIPDTWGFELLMNMGWKPGQGVGPRLTRQEKQQTEKELYNVGMKFQRNTIQNTDDDDDKDITNLLFKNVKVSPYEYESVVFKPKFDTFGLGYESLQKPNASVKSTNKYSKLTIGGKSIHGQAFGVGVYENDDDDIYKTDDLSTYDFTLDDKSQKLHHKSKIHFGTNCIDNFVENTTVKNNLFEKFQSTIEIPPEWRPQGMFDRIIGQCPSDSYSQYNNSPIIPNINVNTRQREIKIPKLCVPVEEFVKKETPNYLSDIISDRFTRAILPDDSTNATIPVARTFDSALEILKSYALKKQFGFWTRKTELWIPDKLLCKRFNIPVPKQSIIRPTDDGKKRGGSILFNSLQFSSDEIQISKPIAINNGKEEQITLENDTTSVQGCPSEKPSIDFFKAIFLDDSDENNFSENNLPDINMKDDQSQEMPSLNKETAKSGTLPKGIFTNLNFDNLFNSPVNDCCITQTDNKNKLYGPFLPENKSLNVSSINVKSIENSLSADEWIEKTQSSKEVAIRQNKHKKHKKHKKKKSHKYK